MLLQKKLFQACWSLFLNLVSKISFCFKQQHERRQVCSHGTNNLFVTNGTGTRHIWSEMSTLILVFELKIIYFGFVLLWQIFLTPPPTHLDFNRIKKQMTQWIVIIVFRVLIFRQKISMETTMASRLIGNLQSKNDKPQLRLSSLSAQQGGLYSVAGYLRQGMLILILKGEVSVRPTSFSLLVRNQLHHDMRGFFSFSKQPSTYQ